MPHAISNLVLRGETAADHAAIREVNEAAFGGTEEADLIEALRRDGAVLTSTVAEVDARVVGHILFSRMAIDTNGPGGSGEARPSSMRTGAIAAVALAPLAVLPRYQRQGIGIALTEHGLDAMRRLGERIVIVVGHPDYYPRFGFSSAKAAALESPFSGDSFMALELIPGALDGVRGRVRYAQAFGL